MKQRILSLLLALCMLMTAMATFPITVTAATQGMYTYTISGNKATITACSNTVTGKRVIPSLLGGKQVVAIGDYAFYGCAGLTSVTIPNTVTGIGEGAFYGCTGLTSITIPNKVTTIEKGTFYNCSGLTNVTIPDGVTRIGDHAFGYCSSLTNITIPASITTIGEFAFYNCSSLTNVTIPTSVTTIGDYAFRDCSGLTNITIPNSVTTIGEGAFVYCNLTDVTIPDSVTTVGGYAFFGCDRLTNLTIGNSVTEIGEYALKECDNLTGITIPDSVTIIANSVFTNCRSLTEINVSSGNTAFASVDGVLFDKNTKRMLKYPEGKTNTAYIVPDGVTTIGSGAFEYCDSLTNVTIPTSVTIIESSALYDCSNLTDVYYDGTEEQWNLISIDSGNTALTNATIHYQKSATQYECGANVTAVLDDEGTLTVRGTGAMYDYSTSGNVPWYKERGSIKKVVIESGVTTTIWSYAFYDCDSLTNVTIGNGVTTIGDSAFYSCNSLTNITIGNSVTAIGNDAFANCQSLTNVTIPDSVTTIGDSAFYYCDSLTNVIIGDSVTTIGWGAFYGCDSLTDVTIGDSVTTIGERAFYGCRSLTNVTTGDGVTTIGGYAFRYCDSLTNITIPDSVTTIGAGAFRDCDSLTDVTIGDSVTTIGERAFYGCRSLTDVTIGDSVTTIGWGAFEDCDSLTNITIPDSVTTIGNYVFCNCYSLTDVTIPDSVTTIGNYAFYYCESLTNVTIPDSVTTIGDRAFCICYSLTDVTISDSVTTIGEGAFANCESLTNITIPDSVTTIGEYAFYDCDSLTDVTIPDSVTTIGEGAFEDCYYLTDVYYTGTKEQWNRISIGSDNACLTNANIHYNYGKYEPTGDIAVIIPNDSGYMPEAINTITINGKGTAYGRFQILKSDGSIAKRVRVPYSVDSGFPQAVTTDDYGYATVAIGNITESRDYTVTFFGNGIQSKSEVMHVTVEPLHFKSGAEVIFEKGIQLGIGVGSEYEIGDLKASAGIFGLDLVGTCKNTFSFDYEYKNQKNAIELVSKSDYSAALEAKLGLFAEAGEKNLGGMEVALPKITGDAGAGIIFGAGYEDEDFNPNDPQDMDKLSRFLLLSVAGTAVGNVTSYIIAQMVESPVNTYQLGTVFKVNGGVKAMETEAGAPNLKFGGTIGGFDRSTVWSSLATMYEDGSLDYAASVDSGKGGELFQAGYKIKGGNDSAEAAFGADFYDNFAKESLQVTAETDPDFKLEKLSISSKKTQETSKLHKTTSTSTVNTITYDDQAAKAVAASYDMIDDFTKGEKAIFNKKELFQVLDKMSNSNQTGTFTTKQQKEEALSFHLPLKLAGFGLEFGVEGAESYDYVSESGIWENGTAYIQAKNDIQTEVEANTLTFDRILGYAEDNIDVILNSIFEAAVGMADEALAHGQATLQKIGDKVSGFVAKIVSPKSKTKAMSILTVEDETALFSTSSLAVTVGDPYIISVEDADGNELTDFSEHPMLLTLQYTTEQLTNAGVSDLSTLSIVRWDDEKGVYVNQGGTLDTLNACVTLEITKPGQYLLAVDNCPPAITQFTATQGMNPQIRAIVSDMSSISEFQFSIDDTILLDQSNFEEHYRHATGEFYYETEGLPAGEHTATIYAKDSFGNEITEAVCFTVDTLTSAITNVTVIPEIISEEVTVSAEVSDANLVLLNAEVTDAYGETVQYSVDMTEENGVYSANLPDIENGSLVAVWVSACTPSGNSSASEKQQAIVMKSTESEPVIVITNVSDNKVHVKCAGFDSSKNQTIYLGLYSANGKLLQIQSAKPDEDVIFSDVSSSGYVRAFIWENTDPVCKATKPILFVPDTETEND